MLLQPFKKEFNIPTIVVKFCNDRCRKFKVVCQEHEFTTLFLIKINHSSECSWVIFTTLIDDKLNGRVG